jgi:serine/threonine-protein kinase HipA
MSKKLNVFRNRILVGTLRDENGKLVFSYERSWLESPTADPLTDYLPLKDGNVSGQNVDSFFSNLLPEGDVLQMISRIIQISPGNVFGLLEKFGGDMSGAYSMLPDGVTPSKYRYLEISQEHLREWIETMESKPLILNAKDARISLSGAQDKISLMMRNDKFFIPIGDAPSTHTSEAKNHWQTRG